MCNPNPSSLDFPEKTLLNKNPDKTTMDLQDDLHRWPTPSEVTNKSYYFHFFACMNMMLEEIC